jgi:hypothetical protein
VLPNFVWTLGIADPPCWSDLPRLIVAQFILNASLDFWKNVSRFIHNFAVTNSADIDKSVAAIVSTVEKNKT